jgi:RNA polymerase sigma-70 factor, ECF subfamily
MGGLSDAFGAALAPEAREGFVAEGLEEKLAKLVDDARRAWPDVEVADDVFVGWLAERLRPGEGLEALSISDLYLACACARGQEEAHRALRNGFLSAMRQAACEVASSEIDEVVQRVLEKVLVGRDGAPPRLAKYRGTGSLESWLRVTTVREGLSLHRARARIPEQNVGSLLDAVMVGDDPEIELLKRTYRAAFRRAFQRAFESLDPRDRNVLRFSYLDGSSIDDLATLYGVHRATVARWRNSARAALLKATRDAFTDEQDLPPRDFESIVRLIGSQLEVTIPPEIS